MLNKLYVSNQLKPVGRIETGGNQFLDFVYDDNASAENAISVTMPPSLPSYRHDGLHPIFAQNLPEGYLGDVIRKTVSKLYGSDDLTLLACIGPSQIGNLSYSSKALDIADEATLTESLPSLLGSPDQQLFDELVNKYALRSGLSGVQPKVMLEATQSEKATLKVHNFIVKSWGGDYPQLAANEYFCMSVARASGLAVSEFFLSDNGKLFIMERFDKTSDGVCFGFEDACVLQGLSPQNKYDGSYERLAKSLHTYVSPQHRAESMKQLFISLTVSWAVQNGDAHLKNFGILYASPTSQRAIAPAFDIVSTTPYLSKDVPALTLAGKKLWWHPKLLSQFAKTHCGLSPREIKEIFTEVINALRTQSVALASYQETHSDFQDLGEKMLEIFADSAKRLEQYIA